MNEDLHVQIERRAALGLRNRWWCIGPSSLVADQPVALTRLGSKLVAWRDKEGRVQVLDDYCPHRGAPLSLGRLGNGRLSCRYHGVEVAGDGTVTSVPAYPECGYAGRKMVRSYPVIEHFQGLWVWFGEDEKSLPTPLEFPEEFTSSEWTGFPISETWQSNYQYVWDNVVDIMHPEYLHTGGPYFETGGANKVILSPTANGFNVQRSVHEGDNVEVQEFIDNGAFWFRVGFYAPPGCGPGGNWRVFPLATPIDEHSCQMTVWRMRKVSEWEADLFRFMFNTKLEQYNWEVVQQDREVLEVMPPWPARENLYQHDIGPTRLRRHVRTEARKQITGAAT